MFRYFWDTIGSVYMTKPAQSLPVVQKNNSSSYGSIHAVGTGHLQAAAVWHFRMLFCRAFQKIVEEVLGCRAFFATKVVGEGGEGVRGAVQLKRKNAHRCTHEHSAAPHFIVLRKLANGAHGPKRPTVVQNSFLVRTWMVSDVADLDSFTHEPCQNLRLDNIFALEVDGMTLTIFEFYVLHSTLLFSISGSVACG